MVRGGGKSQSEISSCIRGMLIRRIEGPTNGRVCFFLGVSLLLGSRSDLYLSSIRILVYGVRGKGGGEAGKREEANEWGKGVVSEEEEALDGIKMPILMMPPTNFLPAKYRMELRSRSMLLFPRIVSALVLGPLHIAHSTACCRMLDIVTLLPPTSISSLSPSPLLLPLLQPSHPKYMSRAWL
ncbi:hypothetical protein K440DRAFT_240929 [Wilcoxina mikolae CBS 423.85]|nr:hypothetical protein K440DRAFT_240929 [Wilcoxina mikolae CBS 423.85]